MDPPPLPSHPLLKSQTIFLPLRPSCRSPLTISSPSKGSVSRFNLHPLGLIYNPDLSQEQRMLYSSTSNLPHEAVLKPPQFSISASELYGYNRTVFADMSFNDNTVQYATTHNPAPSRRRRSQPSLESHPYLTTGQRSPISMHHGDTHGYAHDGTMIKSESQSPAYYASPTSYQMGIPSIPQQSAYFHHYDTTQVQAPYHQMRISLPQHAMTGFLQLFMPLAQDPAMYSQECLPTEGDFDKLLNQYITSLSPKKRDKALIPMKRCENIRAVLLDPKCTTIESAQFRFWAKKMFKLGEVHGFSNTVLHDNKPVAVREDLYHILSQSHLHAQHGGRDKTSGQVRKYYSWVPKELIARYVRNCPNCRSRKCPSENRAVGGYTINNNRSRSLSTTGTVGSVAEFSNGTSHVDQVQMSHVQTQMSQVTLGVQAHQMGQTHMNHMGTEYTYSPSTTNDSYAGQWPN